MKSRPAHEQYIRTEPLKSSCALPILLTLQLQLLYDNTITCTMHYAGQTLDDILV